MYEHLRRETYLDYENNHYSMGDSTNLFVFRNVAAYVVSYSVARLLIVMLPAGMLYSIIVVVIGSVFGTVFDMTLFII